MENDVENPQSDDCPVAGAFRNAFCSQWGGNMMDVRDDSSDGDLDEEELSHLPLEDDEHEREPGYCRLGCHQS